MNQLHVITRYYILLHIIIQFNLHVLGSLKLCDVSSSQHICIYIRIAKAYLQRKVVYKIRKYIEKKMQRTNYVIYICFSIRPNASIYMSSRNTCHPFHIKLSCKIFYIIHIHMKYTSCYYAQQATWPTFKCKLIFIVIHSALFRKV